MKDLSRRGILQLFGVGASVVPLIGGVPDTDSRAVIVTPPTIEVPKPPRITLAQPDWGESEVVVFIRDKRTKAVTRMNCSAFIVNMRQELVDVTNLDSQWTQYIPALTKIEMVATGEVKMVEL